MSKGIVIKIYYVSVLDNIKQLLNLLKGLDNEYQNSSTQLVYITISESNSLLSNIVSSNCQKPVIDFKVSNDNNDNMLNLSYFTCDSSKHIVYQCGQIFRM